MAMKKNWFTKFQPKALVWIGVAICIILETRRGYFKKIPDFFRRLDWSVHAQTLFAFSVASVGIMFIDPTTLKIVQLFKNPILAGLEKTGGFLGQNINPWIILILLYFFYTFAKKNYSRARIIFGALFSGLVASFFTFILKYSTLRARPYGDRGAFCFLNQEGITKDARLYHSFPSGDVVIVAAACYFLWHQFREKWWRGIFLILPLLTAYSRMFLNRHWPSDVFMSLGLGWVTACFFHEYHRFQLRETKMPQIMKNDFE